MFELKVLIIFIILAWYYLALAANFLLDITEYAMNCVDYKDRKWRKSSPVYFCLCYSSIHLLSKYVLNTYYVVGTVLDT